MAQVAGFNARPSTDVQLGRPSARQQVSLETNLLRKGIWVVNEHVQLSLPLDTEDLLGRVYITDPLTMFDLDVLAWLVDRWRIERPADGWVGFTLYELGKDFYGRKLTGDDRSRIHTSLQRLTSSVVTLVGYDQRRGEANVEICGLAHFIDSLQWHKDLNGPRHLYDPRDTGSMRARTFEARLGHWLTAQVQAGNVTYLSWPLLRAMGRAKLAKRLWVYLECQRFKPLGSGRGQAYITLGARGYAMLGLHHGRQDRRRAALEAAGRKICEVDESYESIVVQRNPLSPKGWRLLATRLNEVGRQIRAHERQAARPDSEGRRLNLR
jgi:hypothetical protein